MRLILLGAPGSGKGTQAKGIQKTHNITQLSTGDLLRAAVRKRNELGIEAKKYIDKGELVPDHLVISMIMERLSEKDCEKGFILDGFPRTLAQAEALEKSLREIDRPIEHVIELQVDQGKLVERLVGRRICPNGHGEWHISFNPPKTEGRCNTCGDELIHREDDYEEKIVTRLETFREKTEPLIQFYAELGILRPVDANGNMDEISDSIEEVF